VSHAQARTREANTAYLRASFPAGSAYSILFRVNVGDGRAVPPNWADGRSVLHKWCAGERPFGHS
jgi:hypothetical protein